MSGAGFVRRYLSDPGLEELLAIEGVVIIDGEPAAQIIGVGSGVGHIVGEFEDGAFNTPLEVMSGTDLLQQYGGFGFQYAGVVSNNPCARTRYADGALVPEYWNGNGFIALANKRFRRLIVTRVDTSVGAVSFTRLASLLGNTLATWAITAGNAISVKINGAGAAPSTLSASRASYLAGAGSYPTGFSGGEQFTIVIDAGQPTQVGPVTVTFLGTDQTEADCIARINLALGYTGAANDTGKIRITARVYGSASTVNVTAADAVVTTKTGIGVSLTTVAGDVANTNAVTFAEIKSNLEADITGIKVDLDYNGNLRISSTSMVGTNSIEVTAGALQPILGFALATIALQNALVQETIPAGTEVTTGVLRWVTMQTQVVPVGAHGPYSLRVRPSVDDGTSTSAAPAAVNALVRVLPSGSWLVTNPLTVAAALAEAAIDSAYTAAIDATKNINTVTKQTNLICAARSANMVRSWLRQNVIDASANGCYGRMCVISPPLGTTTRAQARGNTQPGVGVYRDQRTIYGYPGGSTTIPQIATVGLAGGAGFTVTGAIDVHVDPWYVALMTQLAPEENPGQETTFMALLLGIEAGNTDVQNMSMLDYEAFRAAGIAALRMADGNAIIQSGVTSVDPSLTPNLKNIARRRMADYVEDSVAQLCMPYSKKMASLQRRTLVYSTIGAFLEGLKGGENKDNQRIDSYLLSTQANTVATLALGLYRVKGKVKTLPSLDVIVFDAEIGENVVTVSNAA